jgi:hypothetical protein
VECYQLHLQVKEDFLLYHLQNLQLYLLQRDLYQHHLQLTHMMIHSLQRMC